MTHTSMRRAGVAAALAALALGGVAPAAGADPGFRVVADHLNNPRQIVVHDGDVYVAEAGTGGNVCLPAVGACLGFTGSVTRVSDGHARRVQTGMLSVNSPEGDVVGLDSLTFSGGHLYGVVTGACGLTGVPPRALAQAGKVLRLRGGRSATAVGDASTIECTTDPDGQGPDTDPYGLAAKGST